jgi:fructose/tagatose bisphosphate aldolase
MKFPVPTGVIYGKDVQTLFKHAQENNYAIPAVNVV